MVSRRTLLGGAAAGVALTPAAVAHAETGSFEHAVADVAARLDRRLIALRRDLHRHPEVAGQERRTAAVVVRHLRAAGLDVTTGVGGHGVTAVVRGARRGRTVAYRADMDAVPPEGQQGGGPTPAHVCGHDIHTTVGVGVATVLARLRHRLAGTVQFVFQPAEEALSGAAAMLDDGVFARTRPEEIHALHCGPFPVGEFATNTGFGYPGLDQGTVTLTDPAAARELATRITALGTVALPSTQAALEQLVADVQVPDGPLARFVFMQATADGAGVRVSYRCWPQERYLEIREVIRGMAGPEAVVSFPAPPFPAVVVPEPEGRALEEYLPRARALHAAVPFSGEDFALFLGRMPGTYTYLGVRAPGAPVATSYPHFGAFTPDERAIGHGVRAMAGWLATRTAYLG